MEQLLIIEDDIGLNQGLSKALKADDRQIISCHDLKAAREQLLCGTVHGSPFSACAILKRFARQRT